MVEILASEGYPVMDWIENKDSQFLFLMLLKRSERIESENYAAKRRK